jgi:hypothetical protein
VTRRVMVRTCEMSMELGGVESGWWVCKVLIEVCRVGVLSLLGNVRKVE